MNILLAVDLSSSMEAVLEKGQELAVTLSADVALIHVIAPVPDFAAVENGIAPLCDLYPENVQERQQQLEILADKWFSSRGLQVDVSVMEGSLAKTILEKAEALSADMIVVGSHGHGAMYHLLVGSVCEGVIHKAHCPVLVVPTHNRSD